MPRQALRGAWSDTTQDISPQQTEYATRLRIPFLTTPWPSWAYVTGVIVDDEHWKGIVPTDDELDIISGVLVNYNEFFHGDAQSYLKRMKNFAPYDIDGRANFSYFIKRAENNWSYRKRTWEGGRTFVPSFDEEPYTLEQVLEVSGLSRYVK